MIGRRSFLAGCAAMAAARDITAAAQGTERVRRLAILLGQPQSDVDAQRRVAILRDVLADQHWIDGLNLRIDVWWSGTDQKQREHDAQVVLASEPDVALMQSAVPVSIAIKMNTRVPVVFVGVFDPVGQGLVKSLAQPGGHITGVTNYEFAMGPKWLQLLKSAVPHVTRVAVLFTGNRGPKEMVAAIDSAAKPLGVTVTPVQVGSLDEINRAIDALEPDSSQGLIVLPTPLNQANAQLITGKALAKKIPSIFGTPTQAGRNALLVYGADSSVAFRQAASYIDRILRGANPGEMPIEAPNKFQLVINQKTAHALGLTIPPSLLARADEVIE